VQERVGAALFDRIDGGRRRRDVGEIGGVFGVLGDPTCVDSDPSKHLNAADDSIDPAARSRI
jgi:hypothetical protein